MIEEEKNGNPWVKFFIIALITFAMAFFAFYVVMEIMLNRMADPVYNAKRIERVIKHQQKDLRKFEAKMISDNPFEPKMRPMLVNLVKEPTEYKVIIDLKPLDSNEKLVNLDIENNILTITGEMDKKTYSGEKIVRFSQSYSLENDLEENKITKEKKGDKYIITIPYENKD